MEQKGKAKYSLWANTAFMAKAAWRHGRSLLAICMLVAFMKAGETVLELLIAPVILEKIENRVPIGELLTAIGAFALGLILIKGGRAYMEHVYRFVRIRVRMGLAMEISDKAAQTSYSNTLDTRFMNAQGRG